MDTAITTAEDAEKSFFKLCEFERFQVDKYVIEHDLHKWKLQLKYKMKGDKIQLEVYVPYAEMNLELKETQKDPEFYGKNTARITISNKIANNSGHWDYVTGKTINLTMSTDVQYVLFNTPYFYPHNTYNFYNKEYLYKKISYSVNFLQNFLSAYINLFSSGVPLIYIKQTREDKDTYEIDIVAKEYMTITYVKADVSTATYYFHLLVEGNKQKKPKQNDKADDKKTEEATSKFHLINLKVPRTIRTGNVDIKFTASMI